MRDTYQTFTHLSCREVAGKDYRIRWTKRSEHIVIVAPHGGHIEPGTSEIATALAGDDFSVYCFEGCKASNNRSLHITSVHFDEPQALQLIDSAWTVVTVHGYGEEGRCVYVGGLNHPLKVEILAALRAARFRAEEGSHLFPGSSPLNLCNRGASQVGVQLEITQGLRAAMFLSLQRRSIRSALFRRFVSVVRRALLRHAASIKLQDKSTRGEEQNDGIQAALLRR